MPQKKIIALLLAAGCLALAGCDRRDGSAVVVGYAQVGTESAWRTAETRSIRGEAKKRGIALRFSNGENQQQNQIRAVRNFIAQKVDAILLSPKVATGWEDVLQEAKRAEIPVFIVDRAVDVSDPALFVTRLGPDCVEEGRVAGRWLAKKLAGRGNVVILEGSPGSSPAIDRQNGFMAIVDQHPEIKIIESQSGDFLRSKGKEVMEALLKKWEGREDKINALYAHNDDMAIGAIQAIKAAGLKPGSDIVVISIDGVRGAFDAMVAGELNCTVECQPLYGPWVFDAVEKQLRGETVERWIKLPTRYFEQSQAKDVIDSREY